MRRDIYQEYTTWVPADAADLIWYSRPVPDDMILQLSLLAIYSPTMTANSNIAYGIDNHGQFLPMGFIYFATAYKISYHYPHAALILLYEHQRLQLNFLTVNSGKVHHLALHGILYDAAEWRKGKD